MAMDFEVAVVGAGPGGLVAALYLRRFLRSTVVVSSAPSRASWIPRTHNLLGYRKGISGSQLLKKLNEQVMDLGCGRIEGEFRVFPSRKGFRLESQDAEFTAERVILATGMSDVQPMIENLGELRRRGRMRYCPVCDAFEYRGKTIVVLAQDEHGVKTAGFLAKFSRHVFVIWPPSQVFSKSLRQLCTRYRVHVREGEILRIEETSGGGVVVDLQLREGRAVSVRADICYVALGVTINDIAFRHLKSLRRNSSGHLLTDSHQELPISGLFAVGDCVEGLAQITVAAGQAAVAATRVHNELRY